MPPYSGEIPPSPTYPYFPIPYPLSLPLSPPHPVSPLQFSRHLLLPQLPCLHGRVAEHPRALYWRPTLRGCHWLAWMVYDVMHPYQKR